MLTRTESAMPTLMRFVVSRGAVKHEPVAVMCCDLPVTAVSTLTAPSDDDLERCWGGFLVRVG